MFVDLARVVQLIRKYCRTRDESVKRELLPVIERCRLNLDVICRTAEKEGSHYFKKLARVLSICIS